MSEVTFQLTNTPSHIIQIRSYQSDGTLGQTYNNPTTDVSYTGYQNGKVVLTHDRVNDNTRGWHYYTASDTYINLGKDDYCNFTIPSNAVGEATIYISGGTNNDRIYLYESTGWATGIIPEKGDYTPPEPPPTPPTPPEPIPNKIIYGNETLIDLTFDTVTTETVLEGYTFHGSDGQLKTGSASAGGGSNKMNIDGSNADTSVTFPNSAVTIGSRGLSYKQEISWNWEVLSSSPPGKPCCAVVYNNKIYTLGENGTGYYNRFYSFDGTAWSRELDLPFEFKYGGVVVNDDKLHVFGYDSNTGISYHRTWDGTTWELESDDLPSNVKKCLPFYRGVSALSYNGNIYLVCTYSNSSIYVGIYKLENGVWSTIMTPRSTYNGLGQYSTILNDVVHVFIYNTSNTGNTHLCYNLSTNQISSGINAPFANANYNRDELAIAYNNKLYILGGMTQNFNSFYRLTEYETNWESQGTIPNNTSYNGAVVEFDGYIYLLVNYHTYRAKNYQIVDVLNEKSGTLVQGNNSIANGDYSYARGTNCIAMGNYSGAEGIDNFVSGDFQKVFTGGYKYGTSRFTFGHSLYNTKITETPVNIDARYGCSGTIEIQSGSSFVLNIKTDRLNGGIYIFIIGSSTSTRMLMFIIGGDGMQPIYKTDTYYSINYYPQQEYDIQFTRSSNYSYSEKWQYTIIRIT